nr:PREDICTED: uncharacterized protein LOC106706933 [Latimeria chalumnae]|eukprot:XP_014354047.1 PREDICTED: uncharacterized protein LOC106706933 [Latimeria chalumnae]
MEGKGASRRSGTNTHRGKRDDDSNGHAGELHLFNAYKHNHQVSSGSHLTECWSDCSSNCHRDYPHLHGDCVLIENIQQAKQNKAGAETHPHQKDVYNSKSTAPKWDQQWSDDNWIREIYCIR